MLSRKSRIVLFNKIGMSELYKNDAQYATGKITICEILRVDETGQIRMVRYTSPDFIT
jgi:hypothetical protein